MFIQGTFVFEGGILVEKQDHYMEIAIDLAKRGRGWVNPNPSCGSSHC